MNDRPHKLFQFGLRDILWSVLVLALLLGWYLDRSRLANRIEWLELIELVRSTVTPRTGELREVPADCE